jgi:putative oxidoreductase
MKSLSGIQPLAFALLRIVSGSLFFYHGGQKLFGGHASIHDPWLLIAGIIEFAGGILIVLGLFTRPAALVACGETVVMYLKYHSLGGLFPITNHGELAVLYCFVFFYIACHGGGKFALQKS